MDLRPHKKDNKEDLEVVAEIKADIPAQSEIQVMLSFSNDSTIWSNWYNILSGKGPKGAYSVNANFNYFQYKLVILNKGVEQTPTIRGIRFSFNVPL
jgi:hypothetical protein